MKAFFICMAILGQALCYWRLLLLGNLRHHIPEALSFFAGTFFLYLLTLRLLPAAGGTARTSSAANSGYLLLLVLGAAVLFRLILWPATPWLSDDIYRYAWEGRVIANGQNPFALAPAAPELAHLRDPAIFPLVARPNLTAIYPPVAQLIFCAASAVSYSVASLKTVFILFDLAVIALLLAILSELGKSPLQAAIYALNPLVIVEFSGSGHLDSAGIFFMTLGLYLFLKRRVSWSAAAFSLGILVKLLPALLLPILGRKKKLVPAAVAAAIAGAAFLPFVDAGRGLYASLALYADNWVFNGSLFTVLIQLVPDNQSARRIAAFLFCLCAAGLYYRLYKKEGRGRPENIFRAAIGVLGLAMLFTPVLHPWYVCWLVPLLAISPDRAWLLFSGLVFAAYWVLRDFAHTGLWRESPAVLLLEYLPLYGLLALDYIRKKKITGEGSCEHTQPV